MRSLRKIEGDYRRAYGLVHYSNTMLPERKCNGRHLIMHCKLDIEQFFK